MRRWNPPPRGRTAVLASLAIALALYAVLRVVIEPQYLTSRRPLQFAHVAPRAMAEPERLAQSACWADIDADGDQDLFVANSNGPNRLWRNDGLAHFAEIGAAAGVGAAGPGAPGWAFAGRA